jgi:hypothetical protein
MPDGKIGAACGGRLWGTDVGMSRGIRDAAPAVLCVDAGATAAATPRMEAGGRRSLQRCTLCTMARMRRQPARSCDSRSSLVLRCCAG